MDEPLKFEEAKQAIAEQHNYENWEILKLWQHLPADPVRGLERYYREAAEHMAKSWVNHYVSEMFKFLPTSEWNEELGECLFFETPVCEAPAVTSPISSDWIDGYYTHFLCLKELPIPDEDGDAISPRIGQGSWLPFPEIVPPKPAFIHVGSSIDLYDGKLFYLHLVEPAPLPVPKLPKVAIRANDTVIISRAELDRIKEIFRASLSPIDVTPIQKAAKTLEFAGKQLAKSQKDFPRPDKIPVPKTYQRNRHKR